MFYFIKKVFHVYYSLTRVEDETIYLVMNEMKRLGLL